VRVEERATGSTDVGGSRWVRPIRWEERAIGVREEDAGWVRATPPAKEATMAAHWDGAKRERGSDKNGVGKSRNKIFF
jgi:hypothetical protein